MLGGGAGRDEPAARHRQRRQRAPARLRGHALEHRLHRRERQPTQQQWLLGIEQLIEDCFVEHGIENSNGAEEKDGPDRTFSSFDPQSTAGEGRWAQGPSLIDPKEEIVYVPDAQPLTDDKPLGPAPDPKLYVTYDGSMGKGKPGTGAGAHAQGVANVVNKIKGALD
ncbi:hypothetical protein Ani05nite_24390 [Amorphoplanes nipponensis]|uniref:Uncharacterized protein n=1 Tax=Actinoplanes nipponensis TaxID=135950 RepID=A0A919MTA4_9ACTN|nr:hypothetical protein Ani05nite_24390 [Actinoplanes nipponensis]